MKQPCKSFNGNAARQITRIHAQTHKQTRSEKKTEEKKKAEIMEIKTVNDALVLSYRKLPKIFGKYRDSWIELDDGGGDDDGGCGVLGNDDERAIRENMK